MRRPTSERVPPSPLAEIIYQNSFSHVSILVGIQIFFLLLTNTGTETGLRSCLRMRIEGVTHSKVCLDENKYVLDFRMRMISTFNPVGSKRKSYRIGISN